MPAIGSGIFNPVTLHCAQGMEVRRVEDRAGTEIQLVMTGVYVLVLY